MFELKSKHLWPLVEQFASSDSGGDPEAPRSSVPGWVALVMLDDLRHLQQAVSAPDAPVDAIRWLVDRFGEDDPLLPYSPAGRALVQSIRDWLAQRAK